MKQVLILYASSTGNTEEIACLLKNYLNPEDFEVTMENIEMETVDAKQLQRYDGVLFGTYTYDDGDLPFETEIFCDSLENMDLDGKVIGLFGSGDTAYFSFCEAVDLMKEKFEQLNATIIEHTVKVDLYPDEEEDVSSIKELAEQFQKRVLETATINNFSGTGNTKSL